MRNLLSTGLLALSIIGFAGGCDEADELLDALPEFQDDSPGAADGRSTTLAPSATRPGEIAVNASHVVYLASNGIWRVPKGGGAATQVYDSSNALNPITADDARAYWGSTDQSEWRSVALDGSDFKVMADADERPQAVVNDADAVYVGEAEPLGSEPTASVKRINKADDAVTVLASGLLNVTGLALNDTHVFFSDSSQGGVYRVPKMGGMVEPLATGLYQPRYLAVNATHVYFNTQSDLSEPPDAGAAKIFRVPIDGGAAEELADNSGEFARFMAIGSNNVYVNRDSSGVWQLPISGGQLSKFALANPAGLAFDGTAVFWSDDRKEDADDAIRSAAP